MADKSLKTKAIDIKGKQYVLVSDRILYFNEHYTGSITTELLSQPSDELVVIKATVMVDGRSFTGHSQAKWGDGYINKTSALENCETSAVGRALAMMGIGVIDSVASVDEINKATQPTVNKTGDKTLNVLTQPQRKRIMELCHELDLSLSPDDMEEFKAICMTTIGKDAPRTSGEAEIVISVLETNLQDKEMGL